MAGVRMVVEEGVVLRLRIRWTGQLEALWGVAMKEWADCVWRESEWRQVGPTQAWLQMGRRGWRQGSRQSPRSNRDALNAQDRPLHAEPDLHRSPDPVGTSSDRPMPAERIRRSWAAWECAAMGQVVGLGLVGEPGSEAFWGRAGRGSRGCP